MPDFLTNLSQRVLGTAPLVRPSSPSPFAPARAAAGEFGVPEPEFGEGDWSSEETFGDRAESLSTRSVGKRGDGEGDDLYSSFPADRVEQSADVYNPAPSREDVPAKRSLLPPISDDMREGVFTSQSEVPNDPFAASEGAEHGAQAHVPDERASSPIRRNVRAENGGEEVREERKIAAGTNRSRRIKSEESGTKPSNNLLVPNAEQRMMFDSREQGGEQSGPRRLVAGQNQLDAGDERTQGRDVEEMPFRKGDERSLAAPDRALSWDDVQEVHSNERQRPAHSSSSRRRLLVPNHAQRNERGESGEAMPLPSPATELKGREETSSRTINVTIGRIEVRGVPERKAPPTPVRKPATKGSEQTPTMSLSDYLKRYNGSGG